MASLSSGETCARPSFIPLTFPGETFYVANDISYRQRNNKESFETFSIPLSLAFSEAPPKVFQENYFVLDQVDTSITASYVNAIAIWGTERAQ